MSKVAPTATETMTITANADTNVATSQQTKAKKSKSKKNKSKLVGTKCDNDGSSSVKEHSNNGLDHVTDGSGSDATCTTAINDNEIQAVSEELLRRLQINGGNGKATDVAATINGKLSPIAQNSTETETANGHTKNHNNNDINSNVNCKNASSDQAESVAPCNGPPATATITPNACTPLNSNESTKHLAPTTTANVVENSAATAGSMPSTSNSDQPKTSTIDINTSTSGDSEPSLTATPQITYVEYENELQMPDIMRVIQRELSEPYSIYTYRYFIHNWPKLCFLAMDGEHCVGAIVCKLDIHRQVIKRGYIAMLAVEQAYRKLKVGTTLVQKAIEVKFIRKHIITGMYVYK